MQNEVFCEHTAKHLQLCVFVYQEQLTSCIHKPYKTITTSIILLYNQHKTVWTSTAEKKITIYLACKLNDECESMEIRYFRSSIYIPHHHYSTVILCSHSDVDKDYKEQREHVERIQLPAYRSYQQPSSAVSACSICSFSF